MKDIRIIKTLTEKKKLMYKCAPSGLTVDFSVENLQARRE
jgi:hypothetical protein